MNESVRDVLVEDYEHLITGLELPGPNDRHVLAAAVAAKAHMIVTFNLAHFPQAALEPFDLEALHPDRFIADLAESTPDLMRAILEAMRSSLRQPYPTVDQPLEWSRNAGLPASSEKLRKLFQTKSL